MVLISFPEFEPPSDLRLGIAQKIGLGFAVVILLFILSFLYTLYGVNRTKNTLRDVVKHDYRANSLAHKLEINSQAYRLQVTRYLQQPLTSQFSKARGARDNFHRSLRVLGEVANLAGSEQLIREVKNQFHAVTTTGDSLFNARAQLKVEIARARNDLKQLHLLLESLLRWKGEDPRVPASLRVKQILKLDRLIAESLDLLLRFSLSQDPTWEQQVNVHLKRLTEFLSEVDQLLENTKKQQKRERVQSLWNRFKKRQHSIVELQRRIRSLNQSIQFQGIILRNTLNNQLQARLGTKVRRKNRQLFAELNRNMVLSFTLLLLSLIGGTGTAILVSQRFKTSLNKLKRFAEQVGGGNFEAQTGVETGDEIEELADSLHQMASQLQQTTISRDYLENILESMTEFLVVITPEGRIKTTNPALDDRLGFNPGEIQGRPLDEIVDEAIPLNPEAPGNSTGLERNLLTREGTHIPVVLSISPLGNESHGADEYVCVGTDISKQKRMRRDLEESLREKETLLKEVHHRVKNNLQVVVSLLNLQARETEQAETRSYLAEARDRIHSMALIHEQLYRTEQLHSVSLSNYVEKLTENIRSGVTQDGQSIDVELDIEDVYLEVNTIIPCGLILNELISNALEHGFPNRKDGIVEVRFRVLDNQWRELIVRDNGIGFDVEEGIEELESLGMRLVKQLAERQLKGEIEVDSQNGTRFVIRFPPG